MKQQASLEAGWAGQVSPVLEGGSCKQEVGT